MSDHLAHTRDPSPHQFTTDADRLLVVESGKVSSGTSGIILHIGCVRVNQTLEVRQMWGLSPDVWSALGTLGTWLGSLATLSALIAAILAWRASRDIVKIELARDTERRTDERRAQASLIAGWLSFDWTQDGDRVAATPISMVRNASMLPAFGVEMEYWIVDRRLGRLKYEVLPPGDHPLEIPLDPRMLHTEGDQHWAWTDWNTNELVAMRMALRFKDAAGLLWSRPASGDLVEEPAIPAVP